MSEYYFNKEFGRILIEEQGEYFEENKPIFTIKQLEGQVYQRPNNNQSAPHFLEKHLKQNKKEKIQQPCDYDIEKEINNVMQSVPLTELMKFPTIKE